MTLCSVRCAALTSVGLCCLLAASCATEADGTATGNAGASGASSPSGPGGGGTTTNTAGASGSSALAGTGGSVGNGSAGTNSGGVSMGSGGVGAGSGGVTNASGGNLASAGTSGAGGSPGPGMPGMTIDLVAVTHADGWIPGFDVNATTITSPMVIGAWFDYQYPAAPSCGMTLTKAKQICFAGKACPGATGALGFSTCAMNGLDVSTWPAMQTFVASHKLSTAANSAFAFSDCNPGLKVTGVTWAGTVPNGVVVGFHDTADKTLGTIPIPAGATSVTVPPNVDGTKIASVHFLVDGTALPSWSFCLTQLKLSFQ